MTKNEVKKIVEYWQKTAEHDYETMLGLFKIKRYPDSLFFAHIVLEKILKGHVVSQTKREAPKIHDLVRLYEISAIELSEKDIFLLKDVNHFNISCRYPDYKLKFHKLCTKNFTESYLKKIIKLYEKLCQKLEKTK
ncbi:HEPN domain-containing protein [Patescibacteria group bacterium]